jgi:uncharacterized protein (TIGR02265 family)
VIREGGVSNPESSEALIFNGVVEAAFVRGLADRLTPEVKVRFNEVGINLDRLLPGYPFPIWDAGLRVAATLFPELDQEAAIREVGRRFLAEGRHRRQLELAAPVFRLLGIHRALQRILGRQMGDNVNKLSYTELDPKTAQMEMSYVGTHPEFSQGTFILLIEILGGKNVTVKIVARTPPSATFWLHWD